MITACLCLGLMIYLGSRPDYLPVNQWFAGIPFEWLRLTTASLAWFTYSLPDALWMFALTLSILLLWNFRWRRESIFWFSLAIILGIGFEGGQAFHLVQGTFDPVDLASIIVAGVLPIVFTLQFKHHEKSSVQ